MELCACSLESTWFLSCASVHLVGMPMEDPLIETSNMLGVSRKTGLGILQKLNG